MQTLAPALRMLGNPSLPMEINLNGHSSMQMLSCLHFVLSTVINIVYLLFARVVRVLEKMNIEMNPLDEVRF